MSRGRCPAGQPAPARPRRSERHAAGARAQRQLPAAAAGLCGVAAPAPPAAVGAACKLRNRQQRAAARLAVPTLARGLDTLCPVSRAAARRPPRLRRYRGLMENLVRYRDAFHWELDCGGRAFEFTIASLRRRWARMGAGGRRSRGRLPGARRAAAAATAAAAAAAAAHAACLPPPCVQVHELQGVVLLDLIARNTHRPRCNGTHIGPDVMRCRSPSAAQVPAQGGRRDRPQHGTGP